MSGAAADIRALEAFLFEEARMLDERRFEDWLALFAADGVYWIPATPDQTDPVNQASIAYEGRQLLEVRVRRLRHPANYADHPPVRTRRVIGNVTVERQTEEGATVRSNFMLADFQADAQRVFAGDYVHTLRFDEGRISIACKRVNLLNCDAPMGPIVIPF